jgi:hypothetical protein
MGIGGMVGYVIRRIEMVLAGKQFQARIAWTLSRKTPYVLGQLDVFEHFRIELNRRDLKTLFSALITYTYSPCSVMKNLIYRKTKSRKLSCQREGGVCGA